MAINLNEFAVSIAKKEGGKKQVNIAQIKEVLKIVLNKLRREKASEVLKLLGK